ncbi:MAG: chemotaxis protein CheC [Methanomicrobia archaeon]|nr:chemotaxis protein CheC [Methanomicrobia archaeon]
MSEIEGPENLEFELNAFQKDALNELDYRASRHAVTSLAEMTGVTMNIEVPTVDVVSIEGAEKKIEREKMVAGIFVQLSGGFSGYLLVLFPEISAFSLIDILMGKMPGETKSIGTEMEESALMEIGNMLASSFCDAIADFFQFSMMPAPPSFSFDMMSALVENLMVAMAEAEKTEHVILFKCDFKDETEKGIYGYIMLFPHHDSLTNMLSLLEAEVK